MSVWFFLFLDSKQSALSRKYKWWPAECKYGKISIFIRRNHARSSPVAFPHSSPGFSKIIMKIEMLNLNIWDLAIIEWEAILMQLEVQNDIKKKKRCDFLVHLYSRIITNWGREQ